MIHFHTELVQVLQSKQIRDHGGEPQQGGDQVRRVHVHGHVTVGSPWEKPMSRASTRRPTAWDRWRPPSPSIVWICSNIIYQSHTNHINHKTFLAFPPKTHKKTHHQEFTTIKRKRKLMENSTNLETVASDEMAIEESSRWVAIPNFRWIAMVNAIGFCAGKKNFREALRRKQFFMRKKIKILSACCSQPGACNAYLSVFHLGSEIMTRVPCFLLWVFPSIRFQKIGNKKLRKLINLFENKI